MLSIEGHRVSEYHAPPAHRGGQRVIGRVAGGFVAIALREHDVERDNRRTGHAESIDQLSHDVSPPRPLPD